MKRLKIKSDQINFIGCWNLENDKLCTDIINFFENRKELHVQGVIHGDKKDISAKKTTDMTIDPKNLKLNDFSVLKDYISGLHDCFKDYQEQWPFFKQEIETIEISRFNIQKYFPGDHFSKVHSERTSASSMHRILAFMTYLNDVEDGGSTSFEHYGIKIKPQIGKTLIWPAEWTHAHAGEVLNGGKKYIVTGWMNFSL